MLLLALLPALPLLPACADAFGDREAPELGTALGVPQAPDAEFRPTAEILEARDRYRWEQER